MRGEKVGIEVEASGVRLRADRSQNARASTCEYTVICVYTSCRSCNMTVSSEVDSVCVYVCVICLRRYRHRNALWFVLALAFLWGVEQSGVRTTHRSCSRGGAEKDVCACPLGPVAH